MFEVRRRQQRLTPRQAISVLYREPAPWATPYALPLALDLLGTAVGVNGVTLFLTVERPEIAHELAGELPFGVGALVVPFELDDPAGLVRPFADRDFARLLIVAGDALGVSARILNTALSVLEHDPLAIGQTPAGGAYLTGANLRTSASSNELTLCLRALLGNSGPIPPAIRTLEPRLRLAALSASNELRAIVAEHAKTLPRTWARLREAEAS